jgi:acyl-[acyl-carrier-protein]-phospholipid O-acyltransferase/long-chain-fatty-acid--[acyl-carrier-protein] ligase
MNNEMTFKKRSFLPLLVTNFLGVLNDNFLKTLACFTCVAWVGKERESLVVTLAAAALVLPYLLFSPLAGRLATRYSKRRVVTRAKAAEIAIMGLAAVGLLTRSTTVVLLSILVMGLQSALFSPSKYGLIRDTGGQEGISYGSGAMETFSFAGILAGTLLASFLAGSVSIPVLCLLLFAIALAGWLCSLTLRAREEEPRREARGTINPWKFTREMYARVRAFPGLNGVVLGLAVFWMVGATVQMMLIVYCRGDLGMSDFQTGVVMSLAAVGIGTGCYLAGVVSGRRVRLSLVVPGGVATGVLFLVLYLVPLGGLFFAAGIFLAAFASGFFKVPLDACIQARVEGRELGSVLAYSNQLSFLFMLLASGSFGLLEYLFDTRAVFLFLGLLMTGAAVVLAFTVVGGLRLVAWLYRHALAARYRVRLEGTGVLVGEGPVLLLPNHPALVDPQILYAHLLRYLEASPLVSESYLAIGPLRPLFRRLGAIPVPDLERGRAGATAAAVLHEVVVDALRAGRNVLLYPAGHLADGTLERLGNKRLAWEACRRLPAGARVIGARTVGLHGSIWSRAGSGRTPSFFATYARGILYLLANLIFFLPRRDVSISFHDITGEVLERAAGDRVAFNAFLEEFYNLPVVTPGRARYFFWQKRR